MIVLLGTNGALHECMSLWISQRIHLFYTTFHYQFFLHDIHASCVYCIPVRIYAFDVCIDRKMSFPRALNKKIDASETSYIRLRGPIARKAK